MTNYASIWNSILTEPDLPDVIGSVSQDALNDYLAAHRKIDASFYDRSDSLKDPTSGKDFFDYEIIVGGDQAAQKNGTATPIHISLLDTSKVYTPPRSKKQQLVYQYPDSGAPAPAKPRPPGGRGKAPLPQPNVVIDATNVNFYLSWPSSTSGTPWEEHITGVDFRLEARLSFSEEQVTGSSPVVSLQIVPISLSVNTSGILALERASARHVGRASSHGRQVVAPDDKVRDLVISLISYFATTVGPQLMRSIPLPVLHVQSFELLPRWFAIKGQTITVGAAIDAKKAVSKLEQEVTRFTQEYWKCVAEDIDGAGGVENLVLTPSSRRLFSAAKRAGIALGRPLEILPARPLMASFKSASRLLTEHEARCEALSAVKAKPAVPIGRRGVARVSEGGAAAINQFMLQSLASQFGNTITEAYTNEVSLLVIRGRLGYRVAIGTPAVTVNPGGVLVGSVPVDAFAGLYYQYREINKCRIDWSSEQRLGLGVSGAPKLGLTTVSNSNGLCILAAFDLSGLSLYTGYGFPVDDILKLLSPLFFGCLQGVLNLLAALLSFVVIPVQIKVDSQDTALKLSGFVSSQYTNSHSPASPKNNYFMVVADSQGVKKS